MPVRLRSWATSSSMASERVPVGICQVMSSSRSSSSVQKSMIHWRWMMAVRSWNGKFRAPNSS